uniref:Ig-like domain-containing protein n=1 Tax=Haplochromis burtoni TaxID=8153 RepID=A0A3Q2WWI8_HAPBU
CPKRIACTISGHVIRGHSSLLSPSLNKCFRLLIVCLCWILDAVLTIEPSWSSYFIGEFVTLKCNMNEGRDTDWYYASNKNGKTYFIYWKNGDYRLKLGSTYDSGEYQCSGTWKESNYTKNSNTVSLTVLDQPKAQITSDMRDIPVGGSVTLTCSVNPSSSSGWKYYWYRDENSSEPLTTQDAVFHSNEQISVSQEGLYKCRGGRGNPVYYTEDSQEVSIDTKDVPSPEISSFPILISIGAISGITFIFILLLLYCCKKFKGEIFIFFF